MSFLRLANGDAINIGILKAARTIQLWGNSVRVEVPEHYGGGRQFYCDNLAEAQQVRAQLIAATEYPAEGTTLLAANAPTWGEFLELSDRVRELELARKRDKERT